MIHKKVKFRNEEYWLHDDLISPLDHWDDNGNFLADHFTAISYPIIYNNNIMRFSKCIEDISELKDVK